MKEEKQELVTQAEMARRLGISRQYVRDLVWKGVFLLHDGKLDPIEVVQRIRMCTSSYDSPRLWQKDTTPFNPFRKCGCQVDLKGLARALAPYLREILNIEE